MTALLVVMLDSLRDLLLPQRCVLCHSGVETICMSCLSLWRIPPRRVLTIDGHAVFATRTYDDLAAHVIVGVKDDHKRWLLPLLVEAIVTAALPLVIQSHQPVILVPVPSSKKSVRRRGEDVVFQLCVASARKFQRQGENVLARSLLVHQRRVRDQSGLSASQRAQNLRGAFVLKSRPPAGASLVVVDDVLTTGASMREAARVLGPYGFAGGAVATST